MSKHIDVPKNLRQNAVMSKSKSRPPKLGRKPLPPGQAKVRRVLYIKPDVDDLIGGELKKFNGNADSLMRKLLLDLFL